MSAVLFTVGPSLGHMMRVLPLADRLRASHQVAIATDGRRWLETIRFRGYEPHILPGIVSGAILEGGSAKRSSGIWSCCGGSSPAWS